MIDCEIVLRFFAFRKRSRIKGSVRNILDTCMKDYENPSSDEIEEMKDAFVTRLELAHQVFGDRTFRYLEENDGQWKLSQPLYDATMVALDRLYSNRRKVIAKKNAILKSLRRRLLRPAVYAIVVGRPNTAKAIHKRIDLLEETFKEAVYVVRTFRTSSHWN